MSCSKIAFSIFIPYLNVHFVNGYMYKCAYEQDLLCTSVLINKTYYVQVCL